MNQWWPCLLRHICVTQPQWVNLSLLCVFTVSDHFFPDNECNFHEGWKEFITQRPVSDSWVFMGPIMPSWSFNETKWRPSFDPCYLITCHEIARHEIAYSNILYTSNRFIPSVEYNHVIVIRYEPRWIYRYEHKPPNVKLPILATYLWFF